MTTRSMFVHWSLFGLLVSFGTWPGQARAGDPAVPDDRYAPIAGGWQIQLHGDKFYENIRDKNGTVMRNGSPLPAIDKETGRLLPDAPIGLLFDNPRRHWRPLYPPGEKALIWSETEQARTPRICFRPVVMAGTVPRFLFDYHAGGGILGQLRLGLVGADGSSRWFHEWTDIVVRYVDGRMEYDLRDEAFKETQVRIAAAPLADAVGLAVRVEVEGALQDAAFIWAYGGASAFFTHKELASPGLTYTPAQCARNVYTIRDRAFELERAFDKSDAIVSGDGQGIGIMPALPGWKAHIRGGSSWHAGIGFASPEAFANSPAELLKAATFHESQRSGCVVVEKVSLEAGRAAGVIVIGMGIHMDAAIGKPAAAWQAALERNDSIAKRIVTHTPDPYLDAAVTTLAFGNEGLWGSQAFLHGGWAWRNAYLGWRILYGPTVYGWTDRVRKNILNHCRLCTIRGGDDAGGISHMLEDMGFFYNMDEVFFDMTRHYFDYTDDVELMKEVFPILVGAIERENRRLRPAGGVLYESALNTWISDSHWYIGAQCTQASAYMLGTYEFMAEASRRLGRDDKPFREQAARIREAMQRVLWQKHVGVFAECLDTRGNRLLHPEPELATLYHSAEFGAADPLQVYQMLCWADAHLRQERTPGGGRLYWSANWFPNHGLSYTHSTYEMAFGEELNFAETNFLAGRSDVGYALLRACLSGIFNGDMPGGLSCHAYVDGTQRRNWEFADAVSMWGRTVVEGLFGIRVKRPRQIVDLTPQIPPQWPRAAIETPHFSYSLERAAGRTRIQWSSPVETGVRLRLPVKPISSAKVVIDGRESPCRLTKGTGFTWLEVDAPKATKGTIEIPCSPGLAATPTPMNARQGEVFRVALPDAPITEYLDPQDVLADARIENGALIGKVQANPKPALLFVSGGSAQAPCWTPVAVGIEPVASAPGPRWSPPRAGSKDLDHWTLIDMAKVFNASVPEVPRRVADGAIPPAPPASHVGFGYWLAHVIDRSKPPCDTAWRAKVGPDGVAWTVDGIPFKTQKQGNNVAIACLHNKVFPPSISVPVKAKGSTLYLMIGGETWPAQSHVVNIRITLRYADGTVEKHDLVQPFDIGNCWGEWCGRYFDTPANGFENIGGRSGPAGSSQVRDFTKPIAVDSMAHLLRFALPAERQLDTVELEAIANDSFFGIMGASILKADGMP